MIDISLKHCCSNMEYYADPYYKKEHELVKYNSEVRRYSFTLHGFDLGMQQIMSYCPWCGQKLPQELGEEWCKVIKKELGLDEVFAEEWEKLPEEYKTEEWWRKRGL